ncbi:MAG: hypothetical protein ACRCXD_15005 [Luteolibacter sp.]
MKFFPFLLMAVSLVAVSCERHDFEGPDGTKQLNQPHGAAAHGAAAGHDEHPATAEDGAGHSEKKAAH